MDDKEILKLVKILVGEIRAYGSHGIDMNKIVPNVEKLGLITNELVYQLQEIALDFENRDESSIKAVGKEARKWIDCIENEVLWTKKSS